MKKHPHILLCEFSQESNSFNPIIWDMARFRSLLYCEGLPFLLVFSLIRSPIKGMMKAIRKAGGRVTPGIALRAMSGGPVADDVVDLFIDKTISKIQHSAPFDGIFLSLHGATISQSEADVCGKIIEAIRLASGKDTVIAACFDLHANITPKINENADIICGYQTYPHVDLFETGERAATFGMQTIAGQRFAKAYVQVPMILPASGYTSEKPPFKDILNLGKQAQADEKILDYTVFQMQPWLDVAQAASCVTVIASDQDQAEESARQMADALFANRAQMQPQLISVDEVISIAEKNQSGKPIILADAADSPNAGAVGDSAFVAQKLVERGSTCKSVLFVTDPQAVDQAFSLGVGKQAQFSIGSKFTPGLPDPLIVDCSVQSLHKGTFKMAGPTGKGMKLNIGNTAVLRTGNIDIMVCKTPGGTGDINFYRAFGIDPTQHQLVVVKANTSFRDAYTSIAAEIFVADTPGAASADLCSLPYKQLPRDQIFPFCEI